MACLYSDPHRVPSYVIKIEDKRMVSIDHLRKPAVVFRERAVVKHYLDEFTTFDIWFAGLSDQTFRQIGGDLEPYNALLERSILNHDAF